MIKAGIVGGAGYTGGELIRLLQMHGDCELSFVHSRSHAGKPLSSVHDDLFGDNDLTFSNSIDTDVDVLFLALGHGESRAFLDNTAVSPNTHVIDLSRDFRLEGEPFSFVYGLPEANADAIRKARNVANPGCFATAIQLALLPVAGVNLLPDEVHVTAITGSTGAGQKATATNHFTWRHGNVSVYKPFVHQHLEEITKSLRGLQPAWRGALHFIPMRGPYTRGILASVYFRFDDGLEEARELYNAFYKHAPFVWISSVNPNLKQVVNTNKCLLHIGKYGDMLHVVSVIDNLVKGAAGQAVQNMNLMFGLEEAAGLALRALAY